MRSDWMEGILAAESFIEENSTELATNLIQHYNSDTYVINGERVLLETEQTKGLLDGLNHFANLQERIDAKSTITFETQAEQS